MQWLTRTDMILLTIAVLPSRALMLPDPDITPVLASRGTLGLRLPSNSVNLASAHPAAAHSARLATADTRT